MYSVNRCVPGQELATGARSYAKVGADGVGRKGSRDSGYVDLIPPSSATETAFSTPRAGPCRTAVNAKWARYGSRRGPPDDQSATSTGQHPQRHRRSPVAVPTAAGLARWWRFPWSFPRFSTEVMTDGRGAARRGGITPDVVQMAREPRPCVTATATQEPGGSDTLVATPRHCVLVLGS